MAASKYFFDLCVTHAICSFFPLSIFAFDEQRGRDKGFCGPARLWHLKRWKLGGNGGESVGFPKTGQY